MSLKPCPFCGGVATLVPFHRESMTPPDWKVGCPACAVWFEERGSRWVSGMGYIDMRQGAIHVLTEKWNRRP
jgi:hypothetical protein